MKNIKIKILGLLSLFVGFQSCTNDLNVEPKDDDTFLSEDFFKIPNAYEKALAGVYGNLALTGATGPGFSFLDGIDAGTSQYGRCLFYMQDLSSDMAVWSYEGDNDPGVAEIQRNIWTTANPIVLGMISRAMVEVALVNEFLKQTAPEKLSSRGVAAAEVTKIELYRKEARVVRALAYYHIMDMYGKAPFVTENDPINFKSPEYDRKQLFTFIESELTAVMPDLKAPKTNEYGRVDQGMAKMILAKMYLNAEVYVGEKMYDKCMTECTAIISSGAYALNAKYLNNFTADNNISSELIYAIQSDGDVTQNYGPTTTMINGEVGVFEQNGLSLGVGETGWGGALRLRKQFVEKFNGSAYDNDTRKTIITGVPGDAAKTRSIEITNITDQKQGYILAKYSNKTSTGAFGKNSTFVDTDFPLFRLADVYLMYAEAQMRNSGATNGSTTTNADATSLGYVNALITRANSGSTSQNITQAKLTLNFLLDERARELHWEAHRRQDLIRFNKFTSGYSWAWKGNSPGGVSLPAHFKLYPIPSASIGGNPNLTQNPGY
jgi:hypothetical protein